MFIYVHEHISKFKTIVESYLMKRVLLIKKLK